jgi:hypothetical protein
MTVLRAEDRNTLMKGMVLRRFPAGKPLTRSQLDVGIEQDLIEITRRFSTFDFESYVGCDLDTFYTGMVIAVLISQRDVDGKTLYERGSLADDFDAGLSPDMEWMVETLPMSTRGIFDELKSRPDREEVVSVDDALTDHNSGKKRMIVDHTEAAKRQLRDGPIIRP